jgi:SAM-dependent methyltransferase
MAFDAAAEQYDRFMGRYTPLLATEMAERAGVTSGMRVVDVGCGPGGLVSELCSRVGAPNVAGIDPAPKFVAACAERNPGADIRVGGAEELPWADASFDAALSSLAVGFFRDTDAGIAEMVRVTMPGGVVSACMWDIADGGMSMLRIFWAAARTVRPDVVGESAMPGTSGGDLVDRFRRAGLGSVSGDPIVVSVAYADFDDMWEPLTYGIGPSGGFLVSLPGSEQDAVRAACRSQLPDGSFTLDARAWYAQGVVPTS